MRIFKTKTFFRWMRKTLLTDETLRGAVEEMVSGLVDADLGGNSLDEKIFKKRIAVQGRGKRGGIRTVVATGKAGNWFFVLGFEKGERSDISDGELRMVRDIVTDLLGSSDDDLSGALAAGKLQEIGD